jgi:hypothetical protein
MGKEFVQYTMKRPDQIRAEPQDYKSLIIAMINRLDLLMADIFDNPQYYSWVSLRAKLGMLNAIVVNQCGPEYAVKAAEFKKRFLNIKKKSNSYEHIVIGEDWVEEIAKHFDVLRIIPAKKTEVNMFDEE